MTEYSLSENDIENDDENMSNDYEQPREMNEFFSLETNDINYQQNFLNNFQSTITSPLNQQPFRKSKWTPDEDKMLIESVKKHGMSNWSLVAADVNGRTGKQCRERWTNQLCPALNRDTWTSQEDQILIKQQQINGNLWSKIARFLPGRSANSVKNRWSWLSRHRIPSTLAAQMMPFLIHQQLPNSINRQNKPLAPPMPQIHQFQQTAPQNLQWEPESLSSRNRIAFSEPNVMGTPIENSFSGSTSIFGLDNEIYNLKNDIESDQPIYPFDDDSNIAQDNSNVHFWDTFE